MTLPDEPREPWRPQSLSMPAAESPQFRPPLRAGIDGPPPALAPVRPVRMGLSMLVASLVMAAVVVVAYLTIPWLVRRNGYMYELGRAEAARENLSNVKDVMGFYRHAIFRDVRSSVASIRSFGQPDEATGTVQESSGSGVVVNTNGDILTNFHVIKGARTVRVSLVGGERFIARIVGTDEKTDLALIRIETDLPLHPVRWGDSDKVEVGDSVLAVGNPYELEASVTAGIISAKGRDVNMLGRDAYENFIQTDAAINPGNSGGPLLNLDGLVIGINTAILSRSGGFQGIGLAVPSSMARHVMEQLAAHGRVIRGYLGVGIQDLDPGLAGSFHLPSAEGVLVTQVGTYSPAAKAGLKVEDVILTMDGKPVATADALRNAVADLQPGQKVVFDVFRKGEKNQITVTIEEQPPDMSAAVRDVPAEQYWGLQVIELGPSTARLYGLSVDKGLLVTSVEIGSYAAECGIGRGDVITQVGDTPVETITQLREALANIDPKTGVALKLNSSGLRRDVQLRQQ